MSSSSRGGPGRRTTGRLVGAVATMLLAAGPAPGVRATPCAQPADAVAVGAALAAIEVSVDPCGETAQLADVVRRFRRCARGGTRICTSREAERNFIECQGDAGEGVVATITWNPALRTELERGCGGDPSALVLRDPTASLLHELVHAVQACEGLEPAEHELEAVRVENIYRRAHALCQRTRYGEELLPTSMLVACEPGRCGCGATVPPVLDASLPADAGGAARTPSTAGDTAEGRAAAR